ncbi:hypothetical protein F511_39610 [Dorcoceras hygrometricum]|uniref:Uncharacterized protein n=1 Tax=Dorcoceras hygrometricum TaxID=472368 RepID=A0A2Z7A8I4_9LAMI|nr:hypothetical protein F511_39610 [Dorcoceras hygrometricum]
MNSREMDGVSWNRSEVEFESMLAMEHTGMTRMFKYLEDTGLKGFLQDTVMEMRNRFSTADVSFKAPSKKREIKIEYRLLHDMFAKSLCAKSGSFDTVTSEKFDLMIAISAGLTVNWVKILFRVLLNMLITSTGSVVDFYVPVILYLTAEMFFFYLLITFDHQLLSSSHYNTTANS